MAIEKKADGEVMGIRDMRELLGCHAVSVWKWSREGRLPAPRKLSPRRFIWLRSEVLAALKSLPQG